GRRLRRLPRAAGRPRRAGPARRPGTGESVALLVGQGDAAEVRAVLPGRPQGGGALDRGSAAVPGPPRGRAGPGPAGGPEDPGHDREIRVARGSPSDPDGDGLRPAETPVHDAPGRAGRRRPALPAPPGHAARAGPGLTAVLR